jgi:hypothetical protein
MEESMSLRPVAPIEEVRLGSSEPKGAVLMTVGKQLLWTDLIFLSFVYAGLKGGSILYTGWTLLQGLTGLTLLIVGRIQRGPWSD